MLLNASAPAEHPFLASGPFGEPVLLALIAALVLWVVVYLLYRVAMTSRRDYGMPIRRRLICTRLRVHSDQSAEVPFWWTDIQVQRAVRAYWRRTLRSPEEGFTAHTIS
jgi:hypothetical protein